MSSPHPDSDLERRALLPGGFRDLLPPDAASEAAYVSALMTCCEYNGYGRVKPPLLEFEDSLFSGPGTTMTERAFRLMDPVSRRMMGVRADMTSQIARIASTRLGHLPRPLRLCYAGEVLRVSPDELNPERELVQAGAELVGSDTADADVEVIQLAVDALEWVGIKLVSVDITAPRLVPELLAAIGVDPARSARLRAAVDRKDPVAVGQIGGGAAGLLAELMAAAGSRRDGVKRLARLRLPEPVEPIVQRLSNVATCVEQALFNIPVTIDPVENRGFEYYTGIGFSLFSEGVRGELGRGGRYMVNGVGGEASCGFTLYVDTLLRAGLPVRQPHRVYLPYGTAHMARELQKSGCATVCGLEPEHDPHAAAVRLGCDSVYLKGEFVDCDPGASGSEPASGS